MMTKVEVRNAIGTLVQTLPVGQADATSPYLVEEVTGLGPVKANIVTAEYAGQDGAQYQSARTGGRSMGIKMKYRPNYGLNGTVESLRRDLYTIFPPKALVTLRIFNDSYQTVEIAGVIEDHQPEIFAKEPTVVVSVYSAKPSFLAITPTVITAVNAANVPMNYPGSADVGFKMEVSIFQAAERIILSNGVDVPLEMRFKVPPPGGGATDPFAPTFGDKITYSTVPGNKYIQLLRSGTVYNLLQYVVKGSPNLKIGPLVQSLAVTLSTSANPGSDNPGDWDNIVPYGVVTYTPGWVGI